MGYCVGAELDPASQGMTSFATFPISDSESGSSDANLRWELDPVGKTPKHPAPSFSRSPQAQPYTMCLMNQSVLNGRPKKRKNIIVP